MNFRIRRSSVRGEWALPLVLGLAACAHAPYAGGPAQGGPVPRTQVVFPDERAFSFVVLGDRTGAHRAGVYEQALEHVARLQPDLVLSVGDLIEGNTEDRTELARQWAEIDRALAPLDVPYFFVPGNHDLTNQVQLDEWRRRYGADAYSFTYKGALFLVLNSEDPPQPEIARSLLLKEYGPEAMRLVVTELMRDPATARARLAGEPRLVELAEKLMASERAAISDTQVAMVRDALRDNPAVRWTFVLMHRPAWLVPSPRFAQIERLLEGRSYTVLAGHYHRYGYERRNGMDYIRLGTTGGMSGSREGSPDGQDHLMWISLDENSPRITNIRLDSLSDKQGLAQR